MQVRQKDKSVLILKYPESDFLIRLTTWADLLHFCLVVNLTVGMAMDKTDSKNVDMAVGFS